MQNGRRNRCGCNKMKIIDIQKYRDFGTLGITYEDKSEIYIAGQGAVYG